MEVSTGNNARQVSYGARTLQYHLQVAGVEFDQKCGANLCVFHLQILVGSMGSDGRRAAQD
jgi:hypothetical protein